ncbi:hypothetical protein EAH_00054850, partial [Eimeria acervulina]
TDVIRADTGVSRKACGRLSWRATRQRVQGRASETSNDIYGQHERRPDTVDVRLRRECKVARAQRVVKQGQGQGCRVAYACVNAVNEWADRLRELRKRRRGVRKAASVVRAHTNVRLSDMVAPRRPALYDVTSAHRVNPVRMLVGCRGSGNGVELDTSAGLAC